MTNPPLTGNVFNIQRYSLDDGAGIRTCVFLKGCPLGCVWCHNAESINSKRELSYRADGCMLCGGCVSVCPAHCHRIKDGEHELDRANCIVCGRCAGFCPTEALTMMGKYMTVNEVLRTVLRDAPFFGKNGGVTLSGGEPMMQFRFSLELAKAVKAEGYTIVMETSGHAHADQYREMLPYCDCFYFDCKADSAIHRALTGVEDDLILANLDMLIKEGASVVLRCPIVPGANLTESFAEKIIALGRVYPRMTGISLLPYHTYGVGKPLSLGRRAQPCFEEPTQDFMDALRERIRRAVSMPVW